MAGYNLDAIRSKINQLSGNKKGGGTASGTGEKTKIAWWKSTLGQHDVRFLPYSHNGQPFHEVSYYDTRLLAERRFVSGVQFGLPDPIFNLFTEMKKDRSKEAWLQWRNLQAKERYYAPIIVRGEEDKGVQLWEMNSALVNEIYGILASPDYVDENLMDPQKGYDFTINVTPTDKMFNGSPVKKITPLPRRKPSPLATTEEGIKKIMEGIPSLEAYFKAQVKTEEECHTMLENFAAGGSVPEDETPAQTSSSTGTSKESSEAANVKVRASKQKIDDAFKDL
jgi:hypothetical protein